MKKEAIAVNRMAQLNDCFYWNHVKGQPETPCSFLGSFFEDFCLEDTFCSIVELLYITRV